MNNFLVNIALASSFYEENKNPLDTYYPFILNSFINKEVVKLEDLSSILKTNFNIDIPIYSIKNILNRKEVFVINKITKTNWEVSLTKEGKDELAAIIKSEEKKNRELKKLYLKFIEYSSKNFGKEYNETEIESKIQIFIINNLVDISIEKIDIDKKNGDNKTFEKHLINFINYIKDYDNELTNIFEDIWKGIVIWNELRKDKLPAIKNSFEKNIRIYVDTNFVFSLLGFHNPIINQSVKELYELIKENKNISLYILETTLDEIYRLLDLYPILKDNFYDIEVDSLFYYLKKQGLTKSKIELLKSRLKNNLLTNFNIKTIEVSKFTQKDTDTYLEIYEHLLDIRTKKNNKKRLKKSLSAIEKGSEHDSKVITNTLKFKNTYATNLENSKAIFLTSSFWLYHNYRKIHKNFESFPCVVYDATLTNILYLKTPNKNIGISINQVLKTHSNYLIVDNTIWFNFIETAKELVKVGDINEEDYAILISKNIFTQELLLNSKPDDIDKEKVKNTLDKIKENEKTTKQKIEEKTKEIQIKDRKISNLEKRIENIENERKLEKEKDIYNKKLNEFCNGKVNSDKEEYISSFYSYLKFILFVIIFLALLLSFKTKILSYFSENLNDIKDNYTAIVAILSFLFAAFRSFYDTKKIAKGFSLIFRKEKRKNIENELREKCEKEFRKDNKEPNIK